MPASEAVNSAELNMIDATQEDARGCESKVLVGVTILEDRLQCISLDPLVVEEMKSDDQCGAGLYIPSAHVSAR